MFPSRTSPRPSSSLTCEACRKWLRDVILAQPFLIVFETYSLIYLFIFLTNHLTWNLDSVECVSLFSSSGPLPFFFFSGVAKICYIFLKEQPLKFRKHLAYMLLQSSTYWNLFSFHLLPNKSSRTAYPFSFLRTSFQNSRSITARSHTRNKMPFHAVNLFHLKCKLILAGMPWQRSKSGY